MISHRLKCASLAIGILAPAGALAQTQTPAPQQLNPPPLRPSREDFEGALRALHGQTASPSGSAPPQSKPAASVPQIQETITAPAPVIVEKSLPLTPPEADALRLVRTVQPESAPVAGGNGRVVYNFGEGIPTVITAPEHLSEIDLETGEQIQPDTKGLPMLDLGDWPHWTVTARILGSGDHAQAFLIVKPTFSGQETTLTVPTDRRIYYIRLLSEPHDYIPRIAFRYPHDQRPTHPETPTQKPEDKLKSLDTIRPAKNTAYAIELNKAARKHALYLKPAKVYDDGAHTFIQLPESARHRDLPALRLTGYTGPDAPNWHFDDRDLIYTIECLTDHIELLSGTGRHQFRVTIVNRNPVLLAKGEGRAGNR